MKSVNEIEEIVNIAEQCAEYIRLIERAEKGAPTCAPIDLERAMTYCYAQRNEFEARLRDAPDLKTGTIYPLIREAKKWQELGDAIANYLDSNC